MNFSFKKLFSISEYAMAGLNGVVNFFASVIAANTS
jgi:hypothetical protein